MATIKITEINYDTIVFSDGSTIEYYHCPDCCEHNYADFEQVDDLARDYEFTLPMEFETVPYYGFRFGDSKRKFFVPCYSEQNGYYSSNVNIYYNDKRVLGVKCATVYRD